MSRPLVVLGATGSIGIQTIEVAKHLRLDIVALAARNPSPALADIARDHPEAVVVATGGSADERADLSRLLGERMRFGLESLLEVSAHPGAVVVNGIVGSAGLRSTVAALNAGNRVALANKESLVAGGPVVRKALEHGGGELIPVDSEHSALYQCLLGETKGSVARLVLTASGGPFRGWSKEDLADVTPEEALRHPTWEMGPRVTIDSATLFNKGLEVIEAHHLFDLDYDRIEVVVHPQSVLHSVVEFVDGSWKGHLGQTDMRIPIQYALTAPERAAGIAAPFRLAGRELTFEPPDREAFPALDLCYQAGRRGGSAPAVLNAADEVAVDAFLNQGLGFNGITRVVARTLERVAQRDLDTVDEVLAVDAEARAVAASLMAEHAE